MARIRSIAPGTQRVSPHPSEVDCFWQTLTDPSGDALLHLSTFGSDNRQSKPKPSQMIQLDRAQAEQLVGVLAAAFPGLVAQADSDLNESASASPRRPEREGSDAEPQVDELASALRGSATFDEQWALAGRVTLQQADVTRLVDALAAAPGSRLPLDTVASVMMIRPARLQGALALLQKVMNVEGYQVLSVADAHLCLDVPLLREQFRLDTVRTGRSPQNR